VPVTSDSKSSNPNLESLLNENRDLRRELAELSARNRTLQTLLVEISRKLQISSASIKAAVSSMLSLDFFWDESPVVHNIFSRRKWKGVGYRIRKLRTILDALTGSGDSENLDDNYRELRSDMERYGMARAMGKYGIEV